MGNWIRFLSVGGCFLLSWTYKEYASSKRDAYLLRLALFLTVCGDFFLIISNEFIIGVLLFCSVQLAYIYRHAGIRHVLVVGAAMPFAFALSGSRLDPLERMAAVYTLCLLSSMAAVFFSDLPGLNKAAVKLAMLSFLLCDVNVALYNLECFANYRNRTFFLIWFFYFPAQIILAFSAKAFYKEPKADSPSH